MSEKKGKSQKQKAHLVLRRQKENTVPGLPGGRLVITRTKWDRPPSIGQLESEHFSLSSNFDMWRAGLLKYPHGPKDLFDKSRKETNLRISLGHDENIIFGIGEDHFEATRQAVGFRNSSFHSVKVKGKYCGSSKAEFKVWELFSEFINNEGIIKIKGDRQQRDRKRKVLTYLNKKLVAYINGPLGLRIPDDYNLFEYNDQSQEYRAKFLVTSSN